MHNLNGTITIKFTDGLASLTIDKGAVAIPVGVLDRWLRTKGIKLFRAQQMAMSKEMVQAKPGWLTPAATKSPVANQPVDPKPLHSKVPPTPASEPAKPAGQAKTGLSIDIMAKVRAKHQAASVPDTTDEQSVADKVTQDFLSGRTQPEPTHPEMDKIEAAIAARVGDSEQTPATEEKVNES